MQMGSGGPERPRGSSCPERAQDRWGLSSTGWVEGLQLHPAHPTHAAEATGGICLPGEGSFATWWPLCCWALPQGGWTQDVRE